ncbi:MAG: acylphosphatase [archaeon]|nr:acylphosphatase [archaeon]
MSTPQRAYRVRIRGRVQRLGYRRFILDTAQELEIIGYVRNEKDGSVTVFVQGEEQKLNKFLEVIKAPPPLISIKSFLEEATKPDPKIKYFEIRFSSIAEELQEGFGAMEKEFKDYREEFKDYREEFKDYREEFKDYREEFKDYREEFRSFAERTDQNFKILEESYGEISAKLTQILETLQRESMETRKELTRAVDTLSELVRQFIKSL